MFKGIHEKPRCLDRPIPQRGSKYPPDHSNFSYSQRDIISPRLRKSMRRPRASDVAVASATAVFLAAIRASCTTTA